MSGDDDYTVAGFDPDNALGWDEDTPVDGDLDDAVPRVLDDLPDMGVDQRLTAEVDAIAAGFRERRAREAERFELATNSDYWFCVCFATEAQRSAFLESTGWNVLGFRFLDGRDLAQRLGVDLPTDPVWPNATTDHSLDEFAMTVEDNRSIDV